MSEESKVLQQVFQMLEGITTDNNDGKSLLVIGIEIDENGYPTNKAIKCMGNPAQAIAMVEIGLRMLTETREDIHKRLERASDSASGAEEVAEKLRKLGDRLAEAEKLATTEEETETAKRIREMLLEFKRRVGKS